MPTLFARVLQGWKAAVQAFRESALVSNVFDDKDFSEYETRKLRYSLYWAMYENTAYSDVHSWSKAFKSTFGLYRFIRAIYNPAAELVDFWSDHLMGGALDKNAGDGILVPSALPIVTKNAELRPMIAKVWKNSNWEVMKDVYTEWGAALGDVFLKPVVNPAKGLSYIQIIHPSHVKDIEVDEQHQVTHYLLEYSMLHPDSDNQLVRFNEEVSIEGDTVTYKTFLNGKPYAWNGKAAEWANPYGFVPFIKVQHINNGHGWGWSEFHKHRSKFFEADDMASVMHDQIRRTVNPIWLFKGMTQPKSGKITTSHTDPTMENPQADREEMPAIYAGENADAKALTADLKLDDVSAELLNVLKAIESAYPELRKEVQNVGGEASGKAIREMRRTAETRVVKRRLSYDSGLIQAHKMAIVLGGYHGIDGFSGYSLDDYNSDRLDHFIGPRKVFDQDPMDEAEIDKAFWQAANEAERAGVGLEIYLERKGWSPENITKVKATLAYKAKESSYEAMIHLNEISMEDNGQVPDSAISQNGPVAGLNKNQLRPKEQNQIDKVSEPEFAARDEDGTSKETAAKRQSVTK